MVLTVASFRMAAYSPHLIDSMQMISRMFSVLLRPSLPLVTLLCFLIQLCALRLVKKMPKTILGSIFSITILSKFRIFNAMPSLLNFALFTVNLHGKLLKNLIEIFSYIFPSQTGVTGASEFHRIRDHFLNSFPLLVDL